jgi:hypothetical protein
MSVLHTHAAEADGEYFQIFELTPLHDGDPPNDWTDARVFLGRSMCDARLDMALQPVMSCSG